MAFTANDVKELRAVTGAGMMDCKKALTASDGDKDKAIEFLREKGLAAAAKKATRIAADGAAYAYCENGVGVVVEVNSETDFVAKTDNFQNFVADVAKTIIATNPADVEDLKTKTFIGSDKTVQEELQEKILVIGENIKIRRFEIIAGGMSVAYNHMGGKVGVLVNLKVSDGLENNDQVIELGKDLAMQACAMNPSYCNKEDVPADVMENEKRVQLATIDQDPNMASKPQMVKEKIVMGRLSKYYDENCLVCQKYVKDGNVTVAQHVKQVAKEVGGEIEVVKFVRFEKGEGIEKRQDNLADEVAKMIK